VTARPTLEGGGVQSAPRVWIRPNVRHDPLQLLGDFRTMCRKIPGRTPVTPASRDRDQLGTIGLDDEVDRQAVGGPRLGRPDNGHHKLIADSLED